MLYGKGRSSGQIWVVILPTYQWWEDAKKLRSNVSLTYSHLRELLLDRLWVLGYPADQFGVHSLRASEATAAAGSGVPDRLFKRQGRWKSDTAKDGCVEDAVEGRLKVTQDLGIQSHAPVLCISRVYMLSNKYDAWCTARPKSQWCCYVSCMWERIVRRCGYCNY